MWFFHTPIYKIVEGSLFSPDLVSFFCNSSLPLSEILFVDSLSPPPPYEASPVSLQRYVDQSSLERACWRIDFFRNRTVDFWSMSDRFFSSF